MVEDDAEALVRELGNRNWAYEGNLLHALEAKGASPEEARAALAFALLKGWVKYSLPAYLDGTTGNDERTTDTRIVMPGDRFELAT